MPFNLSIRSSKNQVLDHNWPDLESSFNLIFQDPKTSQRKNCHESNAWINYSIVFKSPNREISFESKSYLLCLKPVSEINRLKKEIEAFLLSDQKSFSFEPLEPNLELVLEKSNNGKFKLFCWIDNGNAELTHYTWDSFGLRLYTDKEEINKFLSQIDELNEFLNNFHSE